MVLEPGADVPTVRANDQRGDPVELGFERPTVLFFYPEDDTPGCTTEATGFDELRDRFDEAGVEVYGVSTDGVESHRAFATNHGLAVDLLADPDGKIARAFDVELVDGRCRRTTFVIVRGTVVGVYEGVTPDGHADEVLSALVDAGLVTVE